jgi:hypothetical protein
VCGAAQNWRILNLQDGRLLSQRVGRGLALAPQRSKDRTACERARSRAISSGRIGAGSCRPPWPVHSASVSLSRPPGKRSDRRNLRDFFCSADQIQAAVRNTVSSGPEVDSSLENLLPLISENFCFGQKNRARGPFFRLEAAVGEQRASGSPENPRKASKGTVPCPNA